MNQEIQNQTDPNSQPIIELSKSKYNWLGPGVFLVVGILIGIGGLLAYQKYFAVKPAAVASPTPAATPDPTAGWKTYTNPKYGFSFKYPTDLSLKEASNIFYEVYLKDREQVPLLHMVIFGIDTKLDDTSFTFQKEQTIGNTNWQAYYSPKITGGPDPSKNEQEYQLRAQTENNIYILRFYGQSSLTSNQTQILSTFKFTE